MTTYLAIVTALIGLSSTVVAVTFELLPERVDLLGFVLQGAGTGAVVATALAVLRNARKGERARWIELGNAYGAAVALVVFVVLALIQAVS